MKNLSLKLRGGLALMTLAGAALAQNEAPVGMSELMVGDLPVTLVYPTAQPAQSINRGGFVLEVATDATPLPGVRRLIVLSHGTGGSATADHALAATLARAGFVVAQPLHAGDNFRDTSRAGPEAWRTRPQEVSRVIDALAVHPTWKPLLQLDKVGVHGMSAGGVTALSLAGAQWRVLSLVQHCLANFDADVGFCVNGLPDPQQQAARKAQIERVRGVDEAYLPAEMKAWQGGVSPDANGAKRDVRPDPRIAAVTLAVPVSAIFSTESLARIRIPVGLVSAGRDTMLLPQFHSEHVLRHCTACTRLADLKGAAHFDLLAPWPASVAKAVAARQGRGGWPEPGFDGRERDVAFAAIASFFKRELAR